jgi:hypothetical protein
MLRGEETPRQIQKWNITRDEKYKRAVGLEEASFKVKYLLSSQKVNSD